MNATYNHVSNVKNARRTRRNNTRRAIVRRERLNALQRRTTRAIDARTTIEREIASREIQNALIDVLNSFAN
jgi:hypothetical protein